MNPYSKDPRLWLPSLGRRPQSRLRLFCFPYAGGGASLFHAWAEHLPPDIEICPVQLPGRENRLSEQAFSHIDELLDPLTQVLFDYLDQPYAFFGHSMGALISFELMRVLRRNPALRQPVRLIVSGHRAPQLPASRPPTYHQSDADFIEELRRLKGTPEAVLQDTELLPLLLPLLRADFTLCETYKYNQEPPLACPISAMGGLQDCDVSRDSLMAWEEQTASTVFKPRFFEGDHFFLHKEQVTVLHTLAQDLLGDLQCAV